jgi:subtilase family serine protease
MRYNRLALLMLSLLAPLGGTNAAEVVAPAELLVTAAPNDADVVTLPATRPSAAEHAEDNGPLANDTQFDQVKVVLRRPPARQAALDALTAAQSDPNSPQFRQWVTPAEFGAAYGPARADIDTVTAWLAAHGLTVDSVAPSGMSVTVSGTAAQFAATFHAQLHRMTGPGGEAHIAPMSDLAVPAALAEIVRGAALSDFFPHTALKRVGVVQQTGGVLQLVQPAPDFTQGVQGTTYYAVTPQDFSTIYNVAPLRAQSSPVGMPITGAGVTIAVAGQTDMLPDDWTTFRTIFGLSGYSSGTLSIIHPGGCSDPGLTADEGEAAIDTEWASAVAPDATIILASCRSTATASGVQIALQNLIESGTPAAAISISYAGCEAQNGLAFQNMWTDLVQQGAAEGLAIFVASGDAGAAGCDNSDTATSAQFGLAVNGLASSAYVTAVGGTEFRDTAQGQLSRYWAETNSPSGASALSYVPEMTYNDSCASLPIWQLAGAANPIAHCNDPATPASEHILRSGGGGQSQLYAKPSWQTGTFGMPADGTRDLPDVSLFAGYGWQHFLLHCMSDPGEGGVPCNYADGADFIGSAAAGTSFAAPAFAGIEALIVQAVGTGRLGNAAPGLYQVAALQFASPVLQPHCNAGLGNRISTACVFNSITYGTNDVPCLAGTPDCHIDSESTLGLGVLSQTLTTESIAWPAHAGWNFATGLGSVNVTNLVLNSLPP